MLSKAVRNIDYLRAVENTNELLSIGGNASADFDKYLSLLRATAQRKDAQGRNIANPTKRISQHLFTYDYVDEGDATFTNAWNPPEEEIYFEDQYDETLQLLQHQGTQSRRDRSSTSRSPPDRPASDRPRIPKELWDQLPIDARLWYCGKTKVEIEQYKTTSRRRAQQMLTTPLIPVDRHFSDVSQIAPPPSSPYTEQLAANQHELEMLLNSPSVTNRGNSIPTTPRPHVATPPRQAYTAAQVNPTNSTPPDELPPSGIRRILSNRHARPPEPTSDNPPVDAPSRVFTAPDGHQYYRISTRNIKYYVSQTRRTNEDSLVDRVQMAVSQVTTFVSWTQGSNGPMWLGSKTMQ